MRPGMRYRRNRRRDSERIRSTFWERRSSQPSIAFASHTVQRVENDRRGRRTVRRSGDSGPMRRRSWGNVRRRAPRETFLANPPSSRVSPACRLDKRNPRNQLRATVHDRGRGGVRVGTWREEQAGISSPPPTTNDTLPRHEQVDRSSRFVGSIPSSDPSEDRRSGAAGNDGRTRPIRSSDADRRSRIPEIDTIRRVPPHILHRSRSR